MNMFELIEISNDELLEIDGGGWLSRIGGVLIVTGSIISGGGLVPVGVGVASGVMTLITGW